MSLFHPKTVHDKRCFRFTISAIVYVAILIVVIAVFVANISLPRTLISIIVEYLLCFIMAVSVLMFYVVAIIIAKTEPSKDHCQYCNYDLSYSDDIKECPECGEKKD